MDGLQSTELEKRKSQYQEFGCCRQFIFYLKTPGKVQLSKKEVYTAAVFSKTALIFSRFLKSTIITLKRKYMPKNGEGVCFPLIFWGLPNEKQHIQ